jgi:hypothetical protein
LSLFRDIKAGASDPQASNIASFTCADVSGKYAFIFLNAEHKAGALTGR